MSTSYYNIGLLQKKFGKTRDSLKNLGGRALAVMQELADANPSVTSFQQVVAVSQRHIGEQLSLMGDKSGALKAFEKALAIGQRLADANPGNTHFQRDLASTLMNIAIKMADMGDNTGTGRHTARHWRSSKGWPTQTLAS